MSNPNFGFNTTGEEVASHYSSQITGRTILITGVSPGGLGFATSEILASHAPSVLVLAGRSLESLKAVQAKIKDVAPNCATKLLELDLGSIHTVRAAATELNSWADVPKLDMLINNAGIMAGDFKLNEDGIENQFATNHIGPWLFTNLIMSKIVAAKGRVVFLSSIGHMYSGVRFDDVNFKVCQLCHDQKIIQVLTKLPRMGRTITLT
jgi:NAD(P)-dependent dehydrogenase (short-subunit alcohol dehydrogenase family)